MASPAPLIAPRDGIVEALKKVVGGDLIAHVFAVGEDSITVRREAVAGVMVGLRDELAYQQLMEIAGVDYPDRPERFEVVYHLLSVTQNHRLRVRVLSDEVTPVPSIVSVWPNAGWLERASGLRSDGKPWTVAVEAPDHARRAPHSILMLENAAVATSGDYRHGITVQGQRLSHTMDPTTGAPLRSSPASVTVVSRTCAEADAWATALMVMGPKAGGELAARLGLDALFLMREAGGVRAHVAGTLFRGTGAIG